MMILYMLIAGLASVAAVCKTLAYATILGPEGFGLITLALLIAALGSYAATFGLQDGIAIEVPVRRARGESIAALRGTVFLSVFVVVTFFGFLLSSACVLFAGVGLPNDAWMLGPFLIASVIFNLAQVYLQVLEQSTIQAVQLFLKSAVPLALILSIGNSWSGPEVLLMETVVLIVLTGAAILMKHGEIQWRYPQR